MYITLKPSLLYRILNEEPDDIKGVLDTPTNRPLARYEELGASAQGTTGNLLSSSKQSSIITPFGQRTNKFVVQFKTKTESISENGKKESEDEDMGDEFIRRAQPKKRCSLVIHGSKPEPGCKFMYDRIEDRVLDASCSKWNIYVTIVLDQTHIMVIWWCSLIFL